MSKIKNVIGKEILDSRGDPTIAVEIEVEGGLRGMAMVPSGASVGKAEAVELRDNDLKRYFGKGVLKAVANVNNLIAKVLIGEDVCEQAYLDQKMIDLDGSENKRNLGANAILGASLAIARAAALVVGEPLYKYLKVDTISMPYPMMNIINGGIHSDNTIDFQEFMICPIAFESISERIRCGSEIFHSLKKILQEKKFSTNVGDEGGFSPDLASNEEALDYIMLSIERAGYIPGNEVTIAIDCASSFFCQNEKFYLCGKKRGIKDRRCVDEQIEYLSDLCRCYPITSIEDGLCEDDWDGWGQMTSILGNKIQLIGDDIFATNTKLLQIGINENVANAILIKPNQIGTLTETFETIALAKRYNYKTIISHRSGETEDTFIADLAVATNSGQIKTGSLSRSDRTSKYNRLIFIEKELTIEFTTY